MSGGTAWTGGFPAWNLASLLIYLLAPATQGPRMLWVLLQTVRRGCSRPAFPTNLLPTTGGNNVKIWLGGRAEGPARGLSAHAVFMLALKHADIRLEKQESVGGFSLSLTHTHGQSHLSHSGSKMHRLLPRLSCHFLERPFPQSYPGGAFRKKRQKKEKVAGARASIVTAPGRLATVKTESP